MNSYFYYTWLPLNILLLIGAYGVYTDYIAINWTFILISWILVGPIGIELGFHRLFGHRQFETYRPIEIILALLGTLSSFSPVVFWVGSHQFHHKKADTDDDVHTPVNQSFLKSTILWKFTKDLSRLISTRDYLTRVLLRDKLIVKISNYTPYIIWSWALFLFLISPDLLFNVFVFPAVMVHIMVDSINYINHAKKFPFNYKNFNTLDNSQNNLILGYLTLGMGWHNNHHHDPRKMYQGSKWWEFDFLGLLSKLLSK